MLRHCGIATALLAFAYAKAGIVASVPHGSEVVHETDHKVNDTYEYFYPAPPDLPYYLDYRQLWNGSGYPPFNATGNPHVTYAQLDFCNGANAGSTAFNTLLYPYMDGYGQFVKDQAVIAWPGNTYVVESQNMIWWLFGYLKAGDTVFAARQKFIGFNAENNHPVHIGDPPSLVNDDDECRIFGDPFTRIKGVYTGNNFQAGAGWYRNL